MALIAIGVTFGTPDSSAQVPTTSSSVSGSLSTASTDATTLATQGSLVATQGTTCSTDVATLSTKGTTTVTDLDTLTAYAATAITNDGTYFKTETCTVSGSLTVGDTLEITLTGTFTGSPQTVSYVTQTSDTTTNMATGLAAALNANTTLTDNAYVVAVGSSNVVYIGADGAAGIAYTTHNSGTTETLTLGTIAYESGLGGVAAMNKIKALGSVVTTDLTILTGDISTVSGDITTIKSEIGTLQTDITTVQGDITAAETIITGMDMFVQADTSTTSTAAILSSGLQSALAFAIAKGIVSP